jgi:hypothetical protein
MTLHLAFVSAWHRVGNTKCCGASFPTSLTDDGRDCSMTRHPCYQGRAQKLLDVIKKVAREELKSENWLHVVAQLAGRSYEQMRVTLLQFLDTDVFNLSPDNCVSFLDPLIESWDVDLATFGMEIVLNRRIASGDPKRFEFVETGPDQPEVEPGFQEFLSDSSLSGTATTEEMELLRNLRFNGKRPTSLYYYRELQSLRDSLHFHFSDSR